MLRVRANHSAGRQLLAPTCPGITKLARSCSRFPTKRESALRRKVNIPFFHVKFTGQPCTMRADTTQLFKETGSRSAHFATDTTWIPRTTPQRRDRHLMQKLSLRRHARGFYPTESQAEESPWGYDKVYASTSLALVGLLVPDGFLQLQWRSCRDVAGVRLCGNLLLRHDKLL